MNSILDELYFYKAMGYKFAPSFRQIISAQEGNIANLNNEIADCNLCELCKTRNHAVVGLGSMNSRVMIVASEVNSREDKSGISEINSDLSEILSEFGLENFYFTHALKCMPNKNLLQRNFWYNQCGDYLSTEIATVRPKLIITLGERAFIVVSGERDLVFESVRGGVICYKNLNILPTYSLEFLAKNPSKYGEFKTDLLQIKGYV